MAQIDAYGLLVEEFKSEDVTDQLAAARRIPIVATCMGPDRCVNPASGTRCMMGGLGTVPSAVTAPLQ